MRQSQSTISSHPRNEGERILATIHELDQETKLMKRREIIAPMPVAATECQPIPIPLVRGGKIKIYPNVLSDTDIIQLREELLQCGLFRQYKIQGNDEPRAHFLLHEDATENFLELQPGYRYATISMKARPLKLPPLLQELAKKMAALCGVEKWDIGVTPVCYRDRRDKIGNHADDDQGEEVILCVMLDSPLKVRPVVVTPSKDHSPKDEKIELFMAPGDAYVMDGEMQKSYSHTVPAEPNLSEGSSTTRIAIVFCKGDVKYFDKDSGRECQNLAPRKIQEYAFGHLEGLEEGEMYIRVKLCQLGAHISPQGGISGNKRKGCDAIVVSGEWPGQDRFRSFFTLH
jgi:alkylated DNA repair dioxygenase AlkB